jgi:hypothetical protein
VSRSAEILDQAVERHLRSFFEPQHVESSSPLSMDERLPSIRVFEVEPREEGGLWTYVSSGASSIEPVDGPRLEFVLIAPEKSVRPGQLLRMTAWYHADPDPSHQLEWGHTLPIGEPWLDDATCDVLLVSKPYTLGEDFEVLDLGEQHVHFYWLLPITESERDFATANGLEALEEKFEEASLAYWNPLRPPVV